MNGKFVIAIKTHASFAIRCGGCNLNLNASGESHGNAKRGARTLCCCPLCILLGNVAVLCESDAGNKSLRSLAKWICFFVSQRRNKNAEHQYKLKLLLFIRTLVKRL